MVRSAITALLVVCSMTLAVFAQTLPPGVTPAQRPPATPPTPSPAANPAAPAAAADLGDVPTYSAEGELPEPAPLDELEQPRITLPTEPIEPYLLQRNNGPFMVMAHTFRGPDAARYAQALAMELRAQHSLPAYVFYLRFQPGHSNIRNVPPTAPPEIQNGEGVTGQQRFRSYDEAAVLVGDCKTIDDSEEVLKRVKKIHSVVLDGLPSIWSWRKGKGLSRALLTTNPLTGSQELSPAQEHQTGHGLHASNAPLQTGATVDPSVLTAGFQDSKPTDPLIEQMNAGPNSLLKCGGPLVLEVANFQGRSTSDLNNPTFQNNSFLRQSPLAAAADRAETLAASLGKCRSLDKRFQVFVYHDRHSSRVYLGPFQSNQDPALMQLFKTQSGGLAPIHDVSLELLKRGFTQLPLAPSNQLTPVPGR